jgi:predicted peptidase
MKRLFGIVFTLALAASPCAAQDQDNVDGFVARVYKNESGQTMPYRLFIPDGYDKRKQYPILLWLHGSGGIGSDNLRQITGDQIPGTRVWTKPESQAKHPAFVLVPQSPQPWDATGFYYGNHWMVLAASEHGNELSRELVQVVGILESLKIEFNLDSKRLYISGQSFGGYGTWNFITKKPDLFAAAIILCGGGNPDLAARAKSIPIWAFQGDADNSQIIASNRAMIAGVEKAGGTPHYTEYAGMGHNIWGRVFTEPGLVDWLFAQHK